MSLIDGQEQAALEPLQPLLQMVESTMGFVPNSMLTMA